MTARLIKSLSDEARWNFPLDQSKVILESDDQIHRGTKALRKSWVMNDQRRAILSSDSTLIASRLLTAGA
jgi:hypothetical protein